MYSGILDDIDKFGMNKIKLKYLFQEPYFLIKVYYH